jgi:hypothetical protein
LVEISITTVIIFVFLSHDTNICSSNQTSAIDSSALQIQTTKQLAVHVPTAKMSLNHCYEPNGPEKRPGTSRDPHKNVGTPALSRNAAATPHDVEAAAAAVCRGPGVSAACFLSFKRTANEPSKVLPSHRLIGYTTALSNFHPQKSYGSSCPRNGHTPIKSYLTNSIKYAGS